MGKYTEIMLQYCKINTKVLKKSILTENGHDTI